MSWTAIACFVGVIFLTLLITGWASRRTADPSVLYTAGGSITAGQNGLAITGDFISSAAIFGSVALFYASGVGMVIYFVAPLVGLCLLLLLLAGPLRDLGRYTIGDVLTTKLGDERVRIFAGISTIVLSEMYIIAQLVAAGTLFTVMFDIPFWAAVITVGTLMALYVSAGGMLATTWVQIIKAVVLISGVVLMGMMAVVRAGGLEALHTRAERALGAPFNDFASMDLSMFSALSISAGLIFGMLGMPHLLVRFLTVPDVRTAQRSAMFACALVAFVLGLLLLLIGPAVLAFVKDVPTFESSSGQLRGGSNMAFIHLASALGGELLFGFIAAVGFSTILAVVSGLGVAIASTVSHDIAQPLARRRCATLTPQLEAVIFRCAAAAAAGLGVVLAIGLQNENVAFLSALAFGIAASTNFPVLILALYWRGLTPVGAMAGGSIGLLLSLALLIMGPTVWNKILGYSEAIFPSDYSALVAIPAAFLTSVTVSFLNRRSLEPQKI